MEIPDRTATYAFGRLLQERLKSRHFLPNQRIITEGEKLGQVFLLCSGIVRVSLITSQGESVVLSIERPPSVLGAMEMLQGNLSLSSVEAVSEVTCLSMSEEAFHRYGNNDLQFLSLLAKDLSGKLLKTSDLSARKNTPVRNRVAWYLLHSFDNGEVQLNKNDMASFLGTTERHLNRQLKFFKDSGVACFPTILDKETLQSFTQDV
ncbi:cAMP-binding protein [Sphaerochaeta pleomorpha str. Grapes]|uniref:cAMP-binding protein n=1 Tax=Sphaerochaeta pleomorpha (strain ATCC BAA-1885 / DSM 22778 / Grapes) TaxID=158190 RepID=G8QYR7_SPHPG|nr:Crp/Fnr family transcriptional regulator [Sphaerochaeta pleomorpha]AEV29694.1 cAMP-binding protein [Sphaerochaeta pleomorpha str. Grapes]